MKSILLCLILLCVCSASVQAQQAVHAAAAVVPVSAPVPVKVDPQSLAAAQQIVKSFDLNSMLQRVTTVIARSLVPPIMQENPGQGDRVEKMTLAVVQNIVAARMSALENNKAIVYAQLFTLPELQQLQQFYGSPLGQKVIRQTPEMMQRNAALDQPVMVDAVQEARKQLLQELKKNGMKIPKQLGV